MRAAPRVRQRPQPRLPARAARRASSASTRRTRTTTSGPGARRCTGPRNAARPRRRLRGRAAALRRDAWPPGTRRSGEFHYPHHQPGRRALPGPQRDGQGHRRRRPRRRHRDRAADVRLRPGRRGAAADRGPAPVLRPRRRRLPGAGRGAGRRVRASGLAPHSVRARAPRLAGGDRPLRRVAAAWSCTSTPASSGARSRSAWPSTACRPIELLADIGLLARPDDGRPCHARRPTTSWTCWPAAGRRSARARPPRPTWATASCPPRRAARAGHPGLHRQRLEHGRSIRSSSCARSRRCARRQAEQPERAGTAGRRRARPAYLLEIGTVNGARALGLDGAASGEVEVDARPSVAARRRAADDVRSPR